MGSEPPSHYLDLTALFPSHRNDVDSRESERDKALEGDAADTSRIPRRQRRPYSIIILNQPINKRAYLELLPNGHLHFHLFSSHGQRDDVHSTHICLAATCAKNKSRLLTLLSKACMIVCADAGADRLLELMNSTANTPQPTTKPSVHPPNQLHLSRQPDAITGDLDSVAQSTLTHYRNLGVEIIRDGDQYSTDFGKCLKYIWKPPEESKDGLDVAKVGNSGRREQEMDVIAFGGLGGRVDQAFSLVHHLFTATDIQKEEGGGSGGGLRSRPGRKGKVYLLSEESLTFVLERGKNVIECGACTQSQRQMNRSASGTLFAENVGIIPVIRKARITIKGFEWDVEDWETEIGGQVSTSNHLRAETVEVETSERVLFTLELAERLAQR